MPPQAPPPVEEGLLQETLQVLREGATAQREAAIAHVASNEALRGDIRGLGSEVRAACTEMRAATARMEAVTGQLVRVETDRATARQTTAGIAKAVWERAATPFAVVLAVAASWIAVRCGVPIPTGLAGAASPAEMTEVAP